MMKVEIRNLGQTDFHVTHGDDEITLSAGDHCVISSIQHQILVTEAVPVEQETAATATVAHEIPSLPDSDNSDLVEPTEPEVSHES